MRAFVRLRRILASHAKLARALEAHDRKLRKHDRQFRVVFDLVQKFMAPDDDPPPPKPKIGFEPRKKRP
ncbi:MAG: hypothetical protein HY292_12200 [Planctomycetes bacterium]|nr:hypothetical protein [Planctomycetota bacterium]